MSAYWTLDNLVLVAENVFEQQKIWLSGGIQWLVAAAAPQHGCDELKLRGERTGNQFREREGGTV